MKRNTQWLSNLWTQNAPTFVGRYVLFSWDFILFRKRREWEYVFFFNEKHSFESAVTFSGNRKEINPTWQVFRNLSCWNNLLLYVIVWHKQRISTLVFKLYENITEIEREDRLNLSILLSRGKENNNDSASKGDWRRKSSKWKAFTDYCERIVISDRCAELMIM